MCFALFIMYISSLLCINSFQKLKKIVASCVSAFTVELEVGWAIAWLYGDNFNT